MTQKDRLYRHARQRLVDSLREKGISHERTLSAIAAVPRHAFVDEALRRRAYNDEALPIGKNQTISQPYTVAYQTMLLDPQPNDRILEVGTGSGYQSAVLCEMGARVFSIERHAPLLDRAKEKLEALGYRVVTRWGDGAEGWPAFAPFDGIIVTAGAREIPEPLLEQLRMPDDTHRAGRLVIPVGSAKSQTMYRITRTGSDSYDSERRTEFRFVPLVRDEGDERR
jgi:protein-L-isoaspartate(D-aspartate) O-methyltransferase